MTLSVEANNLSLHYLHYCDEATALDDLTFRLDGGKIYGLLGRNGAGKSSLLSILAAFRQASSGEVRVDGQRVFENPHITRQICLIRETADTVEDSESVEKALDFAAYMRPNWDSDYADRLVERFQLPLHQKVKELSRGKRAALAVILGLASRAPLTMFDESYLGMDAPSRYIFYDELLNDFVAHPRTMIVSTHLIEEVASLFEEVLIIDKGRFVIQEEADTLRERGVSVVGPAEAVDRFIDGLTVLNVKQLGPTKSAMVYGTLDDDRRKQACDAGLELGPVAIQDLFVYITESTGDAA